MPKIYSHLTTQERAVVMTMRDRRPAALRQLRFRRFLAAPPNVDEVYGCSESKMWANCHHLH